MTSTPKSLLEPPPPAPSFRPWRLGLLVLVALGLLGALAFWEAERVAEAALQDLARAQTTLARSLADDLAGRLMAAHRDALLAAEQVLLGQPISPRLREPYRALRIVEAGTPPVDGALSISAAVDAGREVVLSLPLLQLLAPLRALEREHGLVLLVAPPGGRDPAGFYTTTGGLISATTIAAGFAGLLPALPLARAEAARLGLPPRMAVAGLAQREVGPLGTFRVAVVTSALRLRDRNRRVSVEAVLMVLVTGGLVLAFAAIALLVQRNELDLARALALADLERQQDERLQRASKAATMGTLALGVAHEIATPLGVITGRAEQLLGRPGHDERTTRSLDAILSQARHIDQVIRGLLGMVRGHAPSRAPIAPADIVQGAVALVGHRFAKAQVQLASTVPSDLPQIHGDRGLLEHVLVNLLLNACHASAAGGMVEVSAAEGGAGVRFLVADRGAGISAEDADRVLEPFFTTKPAEEGTGLGLAIAQEIVKSHRGELALQPRPGGGTLAAFTVPSWQGGTHGA